MVCVFHGLEEGDADHGAAAGIAVEGDVVHPGAGGLADGHEVVVVDADQPALVVEGVADGVNVAEVDAAGAGGDPLELEGLQIQLVERRLAAAVVRGDEDGAVTVYRGFIDPVGQGLFMERAVGRQRAGVELDDVGSAVFIADDSVEGLVDEANCDRHRGGDAVLHGGSGDDGCASLDASDHAAAVDRGDLRVGGRPGHGIIDAPGLNDCVDLLGVLADDLKVVLVQGDRNLRINELKLVEVDAIGADVHGIVINLNSVLGARIVDGAGQGVGIAGLGAGIGALGKQLVAGLVIDEDGGNVLVVGGGEVEAAGAVDVVGGNGDRLDLGLFIIHGDGQGLTSAVVEGVPVDVPFCVDVVLGGQLEGQRQLGVVGNGVRNKVVQVGLGVGVAPDALVDVVVCAEHRTGDDLIERLALAVDPDAEAGGAAVAQRRVVEGVDLIAEGSGDGVAVFVVVVLFDDGVAADGITELLAGIPQQEGLKLLEVAGGHGSGQIGRTGLTAELVFEVGALVEHGRIGPGAVVAQNGDGVIHALRAVVGDLLGDDVALNVVAVVVVLVDAVLEVEGHTDLDGAVGGHDHAVFSGFLDLLQIEIRVVGVHVAVAVNIGLVSVGSQGLDVAGIQIQDGLRIGCIGSVIAGQIGQTQIGGGQGLAVDGPGGQIVEHHDGGCALDVQAGAGDVLREEVRVKLVGHGLVGEVVDGVGEAVGAIVVDVITKLDLDLAVSHVGLGGQGRGRRQGLGIHQDIGLGGGRLVGTGHAGALLEDRIVDVAVVGHVDGHSRGHDQALRELTGRQAGLFGKAAFTDVLRYKAGDTRDLGRRHRGTGHRGIAGGVVAID